MAYFELKNSVLRGRRNVYGYILVGFSFLVLSLLTVKIFIPEVNTSAASQTAEQTVGPYKMSMSNDSVATVNIVPTSSQEVYKMTNNLSITNDCAAGATITMTTNSTTSNSLVRTAVNSDSLTKEIGPTTTSGLSNSSWGWSKDNGSTFAAVPKKGATAAVVYDEAVARTSAYTVPVMFGVKVDNTMPSGAYTNDVVYTMTPKQGCLTYAVVWDFDNGTKKSGATYPTSLGWGDTVNLSQLTPTRDGYTFAGWTSTPTGSSSGSSNYTGSETSANLNSSNAKSVTVKAKWCQNVFNFEYTGGEQTFSISNSCNRTGNYKFEVWGAQGGYSVSNTANYRGGYGAYAVGVVNLTENATYYVHVGGSGKSCQSNGGGDVNYQSRSKCGNDGGYNGGGKTHQHTFGWTSYGSGGGATHIATKPGLLANLESYKGSLISNSYYNSSTILIVGAGGGGASNFHPDNSDRYNWIGGNAGGIQGSAGYYTANDRNHTSTGGTQLAGGDSNDYAHSYIAAAFGYGAYSSDTSEGIDGGWPYGPGGGGGWFGGGSSETMSSGGSSYIGSSNLISGSGITKHMTCYSCTTSTAVATRTNSNTNVSATATADYSKTGNGYARITYLGTSL